MKVSKHFCLNNKNLCQLSSPGFVLILRRRREKKPPFIEGAALCRGAPPRPGTASSRSSYFKFTTSFSWKRSLGFWRFSATFFLHVSIPRLLFSFHLSSYRIRGWVSASVLRACNTGASVCGNLEVCASVWSGNARCPMKTLRFKWHTRSTSGWSHSIHGNV